MLSLLLSFNSTESSILLPLYKREELGYMPCNLTESEFLSLYAVHCTNLAEHRPVLSEKVLAEEGLTAGWVAPVTKPAAGFDYTKNFKAGNQVVLIPWIYVDETGSGPAKVKSGYKPKKEEAAIITENVKNSFKGYDDNGTAIPYGIDFIKLFKVGTAVYEVSNIA